MNRTITAAAAAMLAGAAAQASIVASDTFTYPDGNLVGQGGWAAHSGAGVVPIQVTGGMAVLAQGSGTREDANLPFSAIGAGTTLYAGFDMTNSGGNTDVYFAHFLQGTSTFRSRVFITAGSGGDYTIGFSDTATLSQTWASPLTFGTSYRVVISYSYDTGASQLWINPVDASSTSLSVAGTASTPVAGFALRQAAGNSGQTIDNLIVATTFAEAAVPTPGTGALLVLGGAVAARRRRR
jgi:MYXO-CTERM domain-containing protein